MDSLRFIIEVDKIIKDDDGNKFYTIKDLDTVILNENQLSKLTQFSSGYVTISEFEETPHHAYMRGWQEGASQSLETLNNIVVKLADDRKSNDRYSM